MEAGECLKGILLPLENISEVTDHIITELVRNFML